MDKIIVEPLSVAIEDTGFRISHKLQGLQNVDALEYLVEPGAHELKPVDTSDHAMIALIYPAMLNKQALHFEGAVSEELLFKMRFDVMPLLAARDSRLTPVPLTAALLAPPPPFRSWRYRRWNGVFGGGRHIRYTRALLGKTRAQWVPDFASGPIWKQV